MGITLKLCCIFLLMVLSLWNQLKHIFGRETSVLELLGQTVFFSFFDDPKSTNFIVLNPLLLISKWRQDVVLKIEKVIKGKETEKNVATTTKKIDKYIKKMG